MRIGLGTGTTAEYFIRHLITKVKEGLYIEAVATSKASEALARKGGIPILSINEISSLDLAIDGADEIDPEKRLIKGAGGALTREKIIATMSKEMIVIADESKLVPRLGKGPIPIEVIPFGVIATKREIEARGCKGSWRKNKDGSFYSTDNHNWILDIHLPTPLEFPEKMEEVLIHIPGVVETGFFFNLASRIVIGKKEGKTEVIS